MEESAPEGARLSSQVQLLLLGAAVVFWGAGLLVGRWIWKPASGPLVDAKQELALMGRFSAASDVLEKRAAAASTAGTMGKAARLYLENAGNMQLYSEMFHLPPQGDMGAITFAPVRMELMQKDIQDGTHAAEDFDRVLVTIGVKGSTTGPGR